MADRKLKLMVGKSGSGKNYICDLLGYSAIPSYTTRARRPNEHNGREHIFITKETYEKMYRDTPLPALTYFHDNYYFATFEQIENPKYDVFIIDADGLDWIFECKAKGMFERNLKIVLVYSPWYRRLWRMFKRGDGLKKVISRLKNDRKAFDAKYIDSIIERNKAKDLIDSVIILDN